MLLAGRKMPATGKHLFIRHAKRYSTIVKFICIPHRGRRGLGCTAGGIGAALIFWFFCIKAKEY
jgi:hypothetical protein